MTDTVKTCSKCKIEKSVREFCLDKHTTSGYKAHCKVCSKAAHTKWKELNKDYVLSSAKEYREKNRDVIRSKQNEQYANLTLAQKFAHLIKDASRRKTVQCFITVEHLHDVWQRQEGLCAYTKLPLSSEAHQLSTVSLDRIDSDKDYTVDNIQLVCVPVNRMKLDYTEDQFIQLCKLVAQNSNKQTT
jgi:transcription elongation factor Elf1